MTDKEFLRTAHIDINECMECVRHKQMKDCLYIREAELNSELDDYAKAVIYLDRTRHHARVLAFAGWFTVGLGLVTRFFK